MPGEIHASVSDQGEVVLAGLDSAEYLYVQVFEPGEERAVLMAVGHEVVVHAPGAADLWIEAR
ncbi:MAG TPA: hypothetical protein VJU87_02800 [Gemmatimonadaceae bacterium]|nr:hypothetical protein [Gemmatimonadaceae bacterium]